MEAFCRDEDWWDNDGALNTISMMYPLVPIEHPHRLVINDSDCRPLQPGIWYATLFFAMKLYHLETEVPPMSFVLDLIIYTVIFKRISLHLLPSKSQ